MKRAFPTATAVLSILVVLVAGVSASRGGGKSRPAADFVPDAKAAGAPALADGAWRVEAPGYAAELKLLDEAARRAFLSRRTGSPEDPFAPMPGQRPVLLTFLFRIENRGKGDLVFEPDATRLVGRDKEVSYPVGWPDIESAYALLGSEVPEAQRRGRGLLLDGQKVVRADGTEEGLLVFRSPPSGTRRFRLEIALTLPDGSEAGFGAPYRLEPK